MEVNGFFLCQSEFLSPWGNEENNFSRTRRFIEPILYMYLKSLDGPLQMFHFLCGNPLWLPPHDIINIYAYRNRNKKLLRSYILD